jgi:predicted outer membrane protein
MKNRYRVSLAGLGALMIAGAGTFAAEPPPFAPPSVAAADKLTLQKLHDGNQTDVQMGKMAEDKGSTSAVRDFGRRLADDQTVADRKIDEYMRTRGADITALATTTSADPDRELLATKLGLDFDRAFAQQITQDLQDTLDLLGKARLETADDSLRQLYDQLTLSVDANRKAAEDLLTGMLQS